MKKIFLFSAAVLFCASTFAEITRKCKITMTSDKGGTDVLRVIEDNEYTSAFENDADAPKVMNSGNTTNLNIYVFVPQFIPNDSLSTVVTNNIQDYPVSIQTNKVATNYTLKFTKLQGTINFYDAELDSLFVIEDDAEYKFTAPTNQIIKGRFVIDPKPLDDTLVVCHIGNELQINKNPYKGNIVVKNDEGSEVLNVKHASTPQIISLADLPKGRYTVEFNDGKEVFVISVKPDVTPAN